jgi:FeS assembly SUF system regulator
MFRLGKLTDYALLLIHTMSHYPADKRWRTESLVDKTHLPLPTVRKCLKHLVDAELVTSFRGARGGYQLSRPASQISLAAVIVAIEGPVQMTECGHPEGGSCDLEAVCDLKAPLRSVSEIVMGFLSTITLAELGASRQVSDLLPQPIALRLPTSK